MIQAGTKLKVADNSGAKSIQCFKVPGGTRRRYASVGYVIVASVKDAQPLSNSLGLSSNDNVKKKQVVKAVIVRQKKTIKRKDGSCLSFSENAAVIVNGVEPVGSRIFGPIAREVREAGFMKIVSLAEEVY